MLRLLARLSLGLTCCLSLYGAQTKLEILNKSRLPVKIEQISRIMVIDGKDFSKQPYVTRGNRFIGAYAPNMKKPVPFDWVPRGIAWERSEYRISSQKKSAGFPIDLLFESGSGWSFALVKSGGSWENLFSKEKPAYVSGTDLWIKAGATVATIDKPDREKMQMGPQATCSILGKIEGLSQNYQLTIADDGNPELYAQRLLEPGATSVLFENKLTNDWRVTIDGVTQQKQYIQLNTNAIEKVFSFSPIPVKRNFYRDSVVLTFVPNRAGATAQKTFYMVFKKLGSATEPVVLVGPTQYRVSTNLYVPGIFLKVAKNSGQWRFTLTTDATAELTQELLAAIQEHRAGRLSIENLKQKIDSILARIPEALNRSPKKISPEEFKSAIINNQDAQGMTPVLWFGNNIDMIEFLRARGADITAQGNKLLNFAIGSQAVDVITKLLDTYGFTPSAEQLDFARQVNRSIAELLIKKIVTWAITRKNRDYLPLLQETMRKAIAAGDRAFSQWILNHFEAAAQPDLSFFEFDVMNLAKAFGAQVCTESIIVSFENQVGEERLWVTRVGRDVMVRIPDWSKISPGWVVVEPLCKRLSDSEPAAIYEIRFGPDRIAKIKCVYGPDPNVHDAWILDMNNNVLAGGRVNSFCANVGGVKIKVEPHLTGVYDGKWMPFFKIYVQPQGPGC